MFCYTFLNNWTKVCNTFKTIIRVLKLGMITSDKAFLCFIDFEVSEGNSYTELLVPYHIFYTFHWRESLNFYREQRNRKRERAILFECIMEIRFFTVVWQWKVFCVAYLFYHILCDYGTSTSAKSNHKYRWYMHYKRVLRQF